MNLKTSNKATKIDIFSFKKPHMRTFHITWFAFFLCFFGWFGIAPLMSVVREEFSLTKDQIGNIIIASVSITIVGRLIIGYLCDKFGPRLVYTYVLALGSIPVMLIGLSNSYETFLLCRLAIGMIGASFVITQYHTSVMFAPNVVGTANATTAGWGNLGGGVTQMLMPLVFGVFLSLGFVETEAWRYAMVVPGIALLLMAFVYYKFTQDTPEGNFSEIRKNEVDLGKKKSTGSLLDVIKDYRVWVLFLVYGACFGVELTIHNIAAIYYTDNFGLDVKTAGLVAGSFGVLAIFARTLGGYLTDKSGIVWGLNGRVKFLILVLGFEGIALMLFAKMTLLPLAVLSMVFFGLLVHMSAGATFSVVPFVNKKSIGIVSGIVGAGGNLGAVASGFLLKGNMTYSEALFMMGISVVIISSVTVFVRFSMADEKVAKKELMASLVKKRQLKQLEAESVAA